MDTGALPALGRLDRPQHRGAWHRHHGQPAPSREGFRTCLGILRLFKDIAPERAEIAAARAVAIGALTYKSISAIIANRTDRKTPTDDVVIDHPNLRGPGYFH